MRTNWCQCSCVIEPCREQSVSASFKCWRAPLQQVHRVCQRTFLHVLPCRNSALRSTERMLNFGIGFLLPHHSGVGSWKYICSCLNSFRINFCFYLNPNPNIRASTKGLDSPDRRPVATFATWASNFLSCHPS